MLGTAGTSFASTNGQEFLFHDRIGSVYSIRLTGVNQNGDYVSGCFQTPNTDNYISNWWWKGQVRVETWYTSNCTGNYVVNSDSVYVDPVNPNGDWFYYTD
ncbi:hypothetical protein ACFZCP_44365 [Streptomyces sp. NPDC007971]|uniref:hypothetical protein n=1 Tax=Streptomyces sp. NPDC007971 TaxID=3364799 RepID=UPI0036E3E61E